MQSFPLSSGQFSSGRNGIERLEISFDRLDQFRAFGVERLERVARLEIDFK